MHSIKYDTNENTPKEAELEKVLWKADEKYTFVLWEVANLGTLTHEYTAVGIIITNIYSHEFIYSSLNFKLLQFRT